MVSGVITTDSNITIESENDMEKIKVKRAYYDESIIRILISGIDTILAYWNISEEYNNKFIKKYGEDFFEKTKEILILKNLRNSKEEIIEIKEPTNNYYIKFGCSNSIYQVELLRIGIGDDKEYGYKIVSNQVVTPNIKVLLSNYNDEKIRFKNIKNGNECKETKYYQKSENNKEKVEKLYEEQIMPVWNDYKKENGYREK